MLQSIILWPPSIRAIAEKHSSKDALLVLGHSAREVLEVGAAAATVIAYDKFRDTVCALGLASSEAELLRNVESEVGVV